MTKTEAIEMLNKWGVLLPSEASDALDMAIEALQTDVVRCKNCRWFQDTFFNTKVNPYCVKEFDGEFGALRWGITEDSFCSYGERKGGDSE